MPEVHIVAEHRYQLTLSDRDFKLVLKGLANLAGIKAAPTPDDRTQAGELNRTLLAVRHKILSEQLAMAAAALEKARESHAAEVQPIDLSRNTAKPGPFGDFDRDA